MTEADIERVANDVCCALVGVLVVARMFGPKEKTPWKDPSSNKGRKIAVNMCSSMMRRSELKETKRQDKLIKKRYG